MQLSDGQEANTGALTREDPNSDIRAHGEQVVEQRCPGRMSGPAGPDRDMLLDSTC